MEENAYNASLLHQSMIWVSIVARTHARSKGSFGYRSGDESIKIGRDTAPTSITSPYLPRVKTVRTGRAVCAACRFVDQAVSPSSGGPITSIARSASPATGTLAPASPMRP
jgi:hypothetical protein